jgi:hypothetical protein
MNRDSNITAAKIQAYATIFTGILVAFLTTPAGTLGAIIIDAIIKDRNETSKEQKENKSISEWELNQVYFPGNQVMYNGKKYRCLLLHTSYAENWNPSQAPALWIGMGSNEQ